MSDTRVPNICFQCAKPILDSVEVYYGGHIFHRGCVFNEARLEHLQGEVSIPWHQKIIADLQSQLTAAQDREAKAAYERDMAIKEANRTSQKWMGGINECVGEELDYDDPSAHNAASSALEKWARKIKESEAKAVARVGELEAKLIEAGTENAQIRVRCKGLYDDRTALETENATLRASLRCENLPCGHSEQYAYSDNGGKTGICLLCKRDSLEARVAELETANLRIREWNANSDITIKLKEKHVARLETENAEMKRLIERAAGFIDPNLLTREGNMTNTEMAKWLRDKIAGAKKSGQAASGPGNDTA